VYTAGGNGAPPSPDLTTIGGSVDGGGGPGGRNPRAGRGSSVANVRITDPSRRTTYALPARPILLPGLADTLYHRLLDALKDHLPVSTSLKVQVIQGTPLFFWLLHLKNSFPCSLLFSAGGREDFLCVRHDWRLFLFYLFSPAAFIRLPSHQLVVYSSFEGTVHMSFKQNISNTY
jgi:hypothetical protein